MVSLGDRRVFPRGKAFLAISMTLVLGCSLMGGGFHQAELESSENASDSWGLVGDAFIDSNTIEQANARPQGSKYAKKELTSYNDVWSSKSTAHTQAARKASQELDSYEDVLGGGKSSAHGSQPNRASRENESGRGSNGELRSYSDILSFSPSEESAKLSSGEGSGGELRSYSGILSFGPSRTPQRVSTHKPASSRGRSLRQAVSHRKGTFEDEWNSLWTTATAPAPAATPDAASMAKQKARIVKELREVDKAISEESPKQAEAKPKHDAAVIVAKAQRLSSNAERQCKRCLHAWSPAALPCVVKSCASSPAVPVKDGVDHQQLLLNDRVAATMRKCLGSQARPVPYRAAVSGWVSPLALGVHSWVETDPAGGLQGLGVLSGRTAELKNMGGGDLVSAKDMVCDHEEGEPALTLQQAVEPLIAQQRDINSQIAGVAKGGQGEDAVLRWGSLYGYEPLNGGQIVEEEPRKAVAAASKRAAEAGAEVKKLEADEAKLSKEEAVSPVLPRAPSEGALGHEGGGQHEEALASNEEALERTLQEKERLLDTMQTSPEAVELARERGGTVIRAKGYLRRQLGAAEAALEGLQHREARLAVDRRRDAGEVAAEQELRLEELKRARLERQHSYLQATLRKLTAGDGSRAISDAARLAEAGPKARVEALAEAGPKARVQALAEVARAGPWGGGSARRGGAWQELSVGGGGEERELTRRLRRLQGKPSSGGAYDEVLKAAQKREERELSEFADAQKVASRVVSGEVGGADHVFEDEAPKHGEADVEQEAVKEAMRAAQEDEKEMHMSEADVDGGDTPEGRQMEAEAAAKEAKARKDELRREGYIPGIGLVKKAKKGQTWYSGLFTNHRVPLEAAQSALANSEAGSSVPVGLAGQPDAWKVADKDTSGALSDLSRVGAGVEGAVGEVLGPLTTDRGVKQEGGGTPLGQFFGF